MPDDEPVVRLDVTVGGRVQGVGFRYFVLHEAIDLGLAAGALTSPAAPIPPAPVHPPERPAPPPSPAAGGLTRREQEVVVLVAEGLTNRQIADRLIISERTVDSHVANILGKLGLATRTQAAAWALKQDRPPGPSIPSD